MLLTPNHNPILMCTKPVFGQAAFHSPSPLPAASSGKPLPLAKKEIERAATKCDYYMQAITALAPEVIHENDSGFTEQR